MFKWYLLYLDTDLLYCTPYIGIIVYIYVVCFIL